MPLEIREATPADRPALEALIAELQDHERSLLPELRDGRTMAPKYYDYIVAAGREREGTILLAEADGRAVGFMSVWIKKNVDEHESTVNEVSYVSDLVVTEGARGRGIGRAFLERAEQYTAGRGVKVISINALAWNTVARATYERAGFRNWAVSMRKQVGAGAPAGRTDASGRSADGRESPLVDVAREWLRAFNARDLDGLLALYAEDAVHVSPKLRERKPETEGKVAGKAALREWWADAFARLPGLRYEPVTLTADAERVWMEYLRVAPGERSFTVAEILVVRDGRIVESRVYHG